MIRKNEIDLLKSLSSSPDQILQTLFYLGGLKDDEIPSSKLIEGVLRLFKHKNSNIRERAIFVVGIHWRIPESFDNILNIVCHANDDPLVLHAATNAIGAMGVIGIGDLAAASKCVAEMVLNESINGDLRAAAYRVLQRLQKTITTRDYAMTAAHESIPGMPWDRTWVKSLAQANDENGDDDVVSTVH
jgi:hypothetical protein